MCEFNPNFLKNADVGWTGTNGRYFPPDFDPNQLIPMKHLKGKNQGPRQMNMRMIMPFSMYCGGCGQCIYLGTKFNSKCEPVKGEDYLGVRIYRFYGKCKTCCHEYIFKTDPEHSGYTLEGGGTRSYEAWRDKKDAEAELQEKLEKEASLDAMKALEHKTYDLHEEMKRMDQLDELMRLNKRQKSHETNTEVLESWLSKRSPDGSPSPEEEEDDDAIADEMEEFFTAKAKAEAQKVAEKKPAEGLAAPPPASKKRALIVVKKKEPPAKQAKAEPPPAAPAASTQAEESAPGGLGLEYDSSD